MHIDSLESDINSHEESPMADLHSTRMIALLQSGDNAPAIFFDNSRQEKIEKLSR